MSIIQAKKVIKKYNEYNENVINGIDLEVQEGEFLSIIGKSGAGKSTLLYMLSGLEAVTSGSIVYGGIDITKLSDFKMSKLRKSEFGFIFQFYNLIPDISIYDNIAFPLELSNIKNKEIKEKVFDISKKVGVYEKLDKFPHQLSGGEQQRVAIARALVICPKIIFADEPTGNLDVKTGIEILKILKDLNKKYKTTIVMVTHDLEAARYGTRVIKIEDGQWKST